MMYRTTDIKALRFYDRLENEWFRGKKVPLEKLLENCGFIGGRDLLMENGYMLNEKFRHTYTDLHAIRMLNTFIPKNIDEYGNIIMDENQRCLNSECSLNHNGNAKCYDNENLHDCWADLHINLKLAVEIGGNSALKEIEEKWTFLEKEVIEHYRVDKKGLYEDILYRNDKMNLDDYNLNFIDKTLKLNKTEEITVFWTDGWTYINDESENQIIIPSSLIGAYNFACLIKANFDYEALDNEVKEFGKYLISLSSDESKAIDVWEYIDKIAKYGQQFGLNYGIDEKRHIVSLMSETDETTQGCLEVGGSATFIAHMISEDIEKLVGQGDERLKELKEEFLPNDDYNIISFSYALEDKAKTKRFVIINDNNEVSVLDTETGGEFFYLGLNNNAEAKIMEIELDTIVSALNEQDRIMKKNNLCFP